MIKLVICATTLMLACFATAVHAIRPDPLPVTPVIKDGIEYSAPQALMGPMGIVVAKNIKTNSVIWKRQIYEVKDEREIEPDVQWIYITHLAIEGENLIIVNERWQRFKLNLKTQKLSPYGEVYNLSPAASKNGQNIYALSSDGKLYAINSYGDQKWVLKLSAGYTFPPGLAKDGTIYAISAPLRFLHPNSSPVIAKDGTIYASTSEALYAVNPDGILKWKFILPQNSKSSFSTVGNNGTIYLGTQAGIIYALSPDGKVKWEFNTHGKMWHPPGVSSDGMIYAVSIQPTGEGFGFIGQVYAINKDGSQEWMLETKDSEGLTPVIGNDDTIYVSESYSKLYAISPKGIVKWEMEFFKGGPLLAAGPDKNVYYGYEGSLYKIKPDGTKELLFKKDDYDVIALPSVGTGDIMILGSTKNSGTFISFFSSGRLKGKYNLNITTTGCESLAFDESGTVYIGLLGKIYSTLTAINPDGTKKWEFIIRD